MLCMLPIGDRNVSFGWYWDGVCHSPHPNGMPIMRACHHHPTISILRNTHSYSNSLTLSLCAHTHVCVCLFLLCCSVVLFRSMRSVIKSAAAHSEVYSRGQTRTRTTRTHTNREVVGGGGGGGRGGGGALWGPTPSPLQPTTVTNQCSPPRLRLLHLTPFSCLSLSLSLCHCVSSLQ